MLQQIDPGDEILYINKSSKDDVIEYNPEELSREESESGNLSLTFRGVPPLPPTGKRPDGVWQRAAHLRVQELREESLLHGGCKTPQGDEVQELDV